MDTAGQPLFILGVERSGSTWLANMVDSHPESRLYMEPFAPRIDVFPDFPDRLIYLERANRYLREHVHKGIARLDDFKYPFPHRPGSSRIERALVYRGLYPLSELGARFLDGIGVGRPLRHLRFKNLNKNRIENPALNRLSERRNPSLVALKELRLNWKVGLIADLWPQARVVVIVRNPVSQIASILRLLDDGALHELRAALYAIVEVIHSSARFDSYRRAVSELDCENRLRRAVAYWFLSYSVLLEDLDRHDLTYQLVRHESLSQNPFEEARRFLQFAGLEPDPQTYRYVTWSTESTNKAASVMDTRRDSQTYYLDALHGVDEEIREAFWSGAEPFWPVAPSPLRAYYEWLQRHIVS